MKFWVQDGYNPVTEWDVSPGASPGAPAVFTQGRTHGGAEVSTFALRPRRCSACGAVSSAEVAVSLNGERRPDLRGRSLALPGPLRGATPQDPFVYLDFARKEWITCFAPDREPDWARLECEPMEDWREGMVTFAPMVRELARALDSRRVWGDALREKLVLDASTPGWAAQPR
ncbi:MAG: hypothetical protein IPO67_21365 [Deltaproteobacteria bacterium]|nr:hypothetical protein [Deltaproteobacteria bacterium]